MNVILSAAYLPNLHYFYYLFNAQTITIEQHENYQKQSYRNRTQLLSANGVLNLSIPIIKNNNALLITDVEICYKENWQKNHWRAIESAYKNSPYFEFFETDLKQFYTSPFQHLFQFNINQLQLILKLLKQPIPINFTTHYQKQITDAIDLREIIHPKINFSGDTIAHGFLNTPYYQTFEAKFNFTPNLSILDALFNIGLKSYKLLKP